MSEDTSLFLKHLGSTPQLRIVDFFLDNKGSDYSKKEIMEHAGVSKSTLYKIWDDFMQFGILKPTRRYGKAQLYSLDDENPILQKFKELDRALQPRNGQGARSPRACQIAFKAGLGRDVGLFRSFTARMATRKNSRAINRKIRSPDPISWTT